MIVELHILQNFPPASLNRDDTNSPKDCEFGGHRRARISSQCLKRSVRLSEDFRSRLGGSTSIRTKRLHAQLKRLLELPPDPDKSSDEAVSSLIENVYCKMDSKSAQQTSVPLYLSARELAALADRIRPHWNDFLADADKAFSKHCKGIEKELTDCCSSDIALFGRMMAEKPAQNIDAASQVAHAISTNRLSMEMDFFTAVDDLLPAGESGAGMMGIVEYNSSCFYRYSNVDVSQLTRNLRNDLDLVRKTLQAFIHASITAIPSGKQTSTAARTMPSFILGVVRTDASAWSLANAFVKPIAPSRANNEDIVEGSIIALGKYWSALTDAFGAEGVATKVACSIGYQCPENLADAAVPSVNRFVDRIVAAVEIEEVVS